MYLILPCEHRVETVEPALNMKVRVQSFIIVCDICNQSVNYAIRPISGLSDQRIQRLSDKMGIPVIRTRRIIHQERRMNT
jgi:hypothetical protein